MLNDFKDCLVVRLYLGEACSDRFTVRNLVPQRDQAVETISALVDQVIFQGQPPIRIVWLGICYPPSLENTSRFDGSIRHSSRHAALLLQPDTTLSQGRSSRSSNKPKFS
jgi:hypothetical protein